MYIEFEFCTNDSEMQYQFDNDSVYLNYASTSYPKSQIALDSFYKAIVHLPDGPRHNLLNRSLDSCRKRVGKIIGVSEDFVFFTHGATFGLNQVILGFSSPSHTLAFDNRSHNAVVRPCSSFVNKDKGFVANIYDQNDALIQDALNAVAARAPDLLCLTHVSNVNGSIYPVEEIINFFHTHSPSTSILVDASQSAGNISLSCLNNADFIVFPSHKHLHSLPGAAVVIAKKRLNPIVFGGSGSNTMAIETQSSIDLFAEVGTLNFPAIQALVDSLEYAESMLNEHSNREKNLIEELTEGIKPIRGLEFIRNERTESKVGIIALKTKYGSPELHWAPFLNSQRIYVRGGLQCSPLHHHQLGLSKNGSLRLSLGWGTTSADIKKVIKALNEFSSIAEKVLDVSDI